MDTMDHVLVHFRLFQEESRALRALCGDECRMPAHQVRYMLLCELRRLGYLDTKTMRENMCDADHVVD